MAGTPGPAGAGRSPGLLSPLRWWTELLLVAPVAALQVAVPALAGRHQSDVGDLRLWGVALLASGALALPLRHRLPVGVLAFTFCTTLGYWSTDQPRGPVFASLVVALVHVVLTGRRSAAVGAAVAGFVLFPWAGYLTGASERPTWVPLLGLAAWLVALIAVAELVRGRRESAREQVRLAAEAQRRREADERVRIARDIHDSVAHNMSLVSIHAGVALHLLDDVDGPEGAGSPPPQVRESLAVIKEASREALVELRSILGILRHGDEEEAGTGSEPGGSGPGPDPGSRAGPAPRAPVPGLERLAALVERARSTGLEVHLDVQVEVAGARLPRAVDVAAYRIVQESLTNVARHSGAAEAHVRVREAQDVLTVEVLDEGTGSGTGPDLPGGGNGIPGMRERAAALGGRLVAGPRPGQGFAVRAELPLAGGAPGGAG